MTDLDKRWEEFHKDLDTDGVSKASASGALEAMDAKLNQVAVKLDELSEKIDGAAAPGGMPPGMDMMGGMPPMPPEAAGGMPPAGPEGAPEEMPPEEGAPEGGAPAEMPPEMMGGAPAGPGGMPPEMMGGAPMGAPAGPPMGGEPVPSLLDLLGGGEGEDMMGGGDPTLDALQGALSSAKDPEVIRNLAEILLDYSDKMEQEEQQAEMSQQMAAPMGGPEGIPPELAAAMGAGQGAPMPPAESIPPELLAGVMGGAAPGAISSEGGEVPMGSAAGGVPANLMDALLAATTASNGNTKVDELNPIKKAEDEKKKEDEETDTSVEESVDKVKKDSKSGNEEDMAVIIDIKPDENTSNEYVPDEPIMSGQTAPQNGNCPFKALEENPEIMGMTLGDLINAAKESSSAPEKDPNMFINGGEPTDSVTACAGSDLMPVKRSVARTFEEDMDYFASNPYAGREDYYQPIQKSLSEEDQLREMIASIVKSYTSAEAIADVTVGDALDTISLIKSTGVSNTERRFVDTLDLIARYTDNIAGEAATESLMKSKGIDLSAIFSAAGTKPIKKAQDRYVKSMSTGRSYMDPAVQKAANNNPEMLAELQDILAQILMKGLPSSIEGMGSIPERYLEQDKKGKLIHGPMIDKLKEIINAGYGSNTDKKAFVPGNEQMLMDMLQRNNEFLKLLRPELNGTDVRSIISAILKDNNTKPEDIVFDADDEAILQMYLNYLKETGAVDRNTTMGNIIGDIAFNAARNGGKKDAAIRAFLANNGLAYQTDIPEGVKVRPNLVEQSFDLLDRLGLSKEAIDEKTGQRYYEGGVLGRGNNMVDPVTQEFTSPSRDEIVMFAQLLKGIQLLNRRVKGNRLLGKGKLSGSAVDNVNLNRRQMLDLGYHGINRAGEQVTTIPAKRYMWALNSMLKNPERALTESFITDLAYGLGLDPTDPNVIEHLPKTRKDMLDYMKALRRGSVFDRSVELFPTTTVGNGKKQRVVFDTSRGVPIILSRMPGQEDEFLPTGNELKYAGDIFDFLVDHLETGSQYPVFLDLVTKRAGQFHNYALPNFASSFITRSGDTKTVDVLDDDGNPVMIPNPKYTSGGSEPEQIAKTESYLPYMFDQSFMERFPMFFKNVTVPNPDHTDSDTSTPETIDIGNGVADMFVLNDRTGYPRLNKSFFNSLGNHHSAYYLPNGKPRTYVPAGMAGQELLTKAPTDSSLLSFANRYRHAKPTRDVLEGMFGDYVQDWNDYIQYLKNDDYNDFLGAYEAQREKDEAYEGMGEEDKEEPPKREVRVA